MILRRPPLPTLPRLLLPLAALALTACESVSFQSPPSDLQACAPGWEGDWRVVELEPEHPPAAGEVQYLRVTPGCERWWWVGYERDDSGALVADVDDMEEDQEIGFARTERYELLAARNRDSSPSEDDPQGWLLIRHQRVGEAIELTPADKQIAARWVIDDLAPGWVDKRDRRADGTQDGYIKRYSVHLFGTPAELRRLLDQHPVFKRPAYRLEPVDAAISAQLEAAIRDRPKEP